MVVLGGKQNSINVELPAMTLTGSIYAIQTAPGGSFPGKEVKDLVQGCRDKR
jgi:hypothetical protein